jgi:hypothetical protein
MEVAPSISQSHIRFHSLAAQLASASSAVNSVPLVLTVTVAVAVAVAAVTLPPLAADVAVEGV